MPNNLGGSTNNPMTNDSATVDKGLIAELRRHATGNNHDEYGRGWNCAMEEAEAIVRRATRSQPSDVGDIVEQLIETASLHARYIDWEFALENELAAIRQLSADNVRLQIERDVYRGAHTPDIAQACAELAQTRIAALSNLKAGGTD